MALACFICDRMQTRNPTKHGELATKGSISTCLLCNRKFCESHKGGSDGTCEINHATYYKNHPNLDDIYPTLAAKHGVVSPLHNMRYFLAILTVS